jgi:capsular polysaccharide biosynthesis protein
MGILFLGGVLCAALAFASIMLLSARFQSGMDFLVVQSNTQGQDFYSLFKSSEYLSKVLSEAIYSERFIDAVVETGKINGQFLPANKKERLDEWRKMVEVQKNLELGVLSVTVKSDNDRDASRVMNAISEVLIEKNSLFRSGDEKSVEIRVLSGPIIEATPTMKKILLAVGGGFLSGILLAGVLVSIRHMRHLDPRFVLENMPLDLRP